MKIKNLNIKKSLISLALASSLSLSLVGCSIGNAQDVDALSLFDNIGSQTTTGIYRYSEDEDIVISKDSVYFISHDHTDTIKHSENIVNFELGGKVTTTANLNFRLGPTTKYKIIETLKKGTEAEVLGITANNWYIIRVNDVIGFVSGDYVTYTPSENKTIDGNDIHKYVYTTTSLNFRKGPSIDDERITTLPSGARLEYLDRLDNNWYFVRYNDQIGYVSGSYVSTKDPNNNYRDDFIKVIYVTKDISLREETNNKSNALYDISKKEACEVLEEVGSWYKVRCNNQVGYVPKIFTEELTGIFVVVDISEQTLTLYDGNVILLEVDITSGTKGVYDTPYGLFSIQSKAKDTYLTGPGYRSHVDFWMPFYYGYGIHDANWRKVFGSDYYERSGSHGCVNVPPEKTEQIYNTVEVGTKVLVHK